MIQLLSSEDSISFVQESCLGSIFGIKVGEILMNISYHIDLDASISTRDTTGCLVVMLYSFFLLNNIKFYFVFILYSNIELMFLCLVCIMQG